MKYYIKQKVFSIGAKFTVTDDNQREYYYVEGELLSLGKKLHLYDRNRREVALVKQKLLNFLPTFAVCIGGSEVAVIKKKLTLFHAQYLVEGLGWYVEGDVFDHHYTIRNAQGHPVAAIDKVWFTWGDTFELDIADDADEVMAIAVVLAIDAVMDAQEAAAASST